MRRELILTFHGLGDPPDSMTDDERKVWVPIEWFEAILDASPRHGVSLAFDDGNASDVEHVLPALAKRGLQARFFPLAGRIGAAGYLSEEDIRRLSAAGMQIGSQGVCHSDWRTLADDDLREELMASRRTLGAIVGSEITEAACPFGSYDRRVLRALNAAGYRRVFNSDGGTGAVDAWLSPRTTVEKSRPLRHWVELAETGGRAAPSPLLLGKRLIKRLR